MGNKRPSLPDLSLSPWRMVKLYDLKSEAGEIIGSYSEYLHEQASKLGVEIEIFGSTDKIILWEESVFLDEREAELRYAAYPEKSEWRKIRIRRLYPSRTEVKDSGNQRSIDIYFALVIHGEAKIQFFVKK